MAIAPPAPRIRREAGKNRNALVQKIQAANFVMDAASGMSHRQIAEKHGVSPFIVAKMLRWAEQEGFFQRAEDAIRERLIPLSIDVYEKALRRALLSDGDINFEVAERLLKGVRLLASGPLRSEERETVDELENDYETFIAQRNKVAETAQTGTPDARLRERPALPPTKDAEIVSEDSGEASVSRLPLVASRKAPNKSVGPVAPRDREPVGEDDPE